MLENEALTAQKHTTSVSLNSAFQETNIYFTDNSHESSHTNLLFKFKDKGKDKGRFFPIKHAIQYIYVLYMIITNYGHYFSIQSWNNLLVFVTVPRVFSCELETALLSITEMKFKVQSVSRKK
jgi:hypothetical protein